MKSLLEKAREINTGKTVTDPITEEEYELAVAWAKGELSLRQIQEVLELGNVNSSYIFLTRCFRHAITKNR